MRRRARHFYEFGPFRVDATERRLLRDDQHVPLQPKAFNTLLALVQNSGHLLTKEELLKAVWPDASVEENNLTQQVSQLRKALGDGGNGQGYIETVPRLGYRFAPGVREILDEGEGVVVENRTKYHIVVKEEDSEERAVAGQTVGARTPPSALPSPQSRWRMKYFALGLLALAGLAAVLLLLVSGA